MKYQFSSKDVQELKKQGTLLALQAEQKVRGALQKAFDQGLTILGKGIILGRKGTEAFVAETHRKADKLAKVESPIFESDVVSSVIPETELDGVSVIPTKVKGKKQNFGKRSKKHIHAGGVSRSH